jgi:hypothetical protein
LQFSSGLLKGEFALRGLVRLFRRTGAGAGFPRLLLQPAGFRIALAAFRLRRAGIGLPELYLQLFKQGIARLLLRDHGQALRRHCGDESEQQQGDAQADHHGGPILEPVVLMLNQEILVSLTHSDSVAICARPPAARGPVCRNRSG